MPSFEYRHATWAEVCDLGPQGWRLVPVPPIQEVRQVLGQQQVTEPLYVMEREKRETLMPVHRGPAGRGLSALITSVADGEPPTGTGSLP